MDGTYLVFTTVLLTKTKLYATLDINIFGDSAYRCCLWIHGDSRRSGFNRENYLLHISGVLCNLIDYRRIQKIRLKGSVETRLALSLLFIVLLSVSPPSWLFLRATS